jgi:hypothetical protein
MPEKGLIRAFDEEDEDFMNRFVVGIFSKYNHESADE